MSDDASLRGKVALVTGSSKGLGKAIVLRFASLGARVVISYARDAAAADEVLAAARALGADAVSIRADAADVAQIGRLFDEARAAFGRVDTKGPFFVMQAAARHVEEGGRIISIASSSTSRPQPGLGLYGTSKSAPKYLVRVLAQELGARRITVNSLVPGPIDGLASSRTSPTTIPTSALLQTVPLGRLATVEDVADFAEFLASDKSFFLTGEEVLMNGGSSN